MRYNQAGRILPRLCLCMTIVSMLAFWGLLPLAALADANTTTITASPQAAIIPLRSVANSVGVTITGTWTGTLSFQASLDGGNNWTAVKYFTVNSDGTTTNVATSTTTNIANCGIVVPPGTTHIQVIATAAITGSAVVNLTSSQVSAGKGSGAVTTLPGGTSGQVQSNVGGTTFGGFTVGGDGTLNTGTGALTVTKTNGSAFATSATTDTTNASNISSGTLSINRFNSGTGAGSTTFLRGDGTWVVPTGTALGIYGNGADGSATMDGTTTVAGMVPTGTVGNYVYTATRDYYFVNLTVNSGVTFQTGGSGNNAIYRVFCTGTLTNNNVISSNGTNASGNTGASGPGLGTYLTASSGGGGGITGTNGSPGSNCIGGRGGSGGQGAGASASVGTGGVVNAPNDANPLNNLIAAMGGTLRATTISAGTGGGGGTVLTTAADAGAGGSGAPGLLIAAPTIVNNGTISANGGNGSNASGLSGGGGGGGGGGVIVLVYQTGQLTLGTVTVNGGTHGAGNSTGANGVDGSPGTIVKIAN